MPHQHVDDAPRVVDVYAELSYLNGVSPGLLADNTVRVCVRTYPPYVMPPLSNPIPSLDVLRNATVSPQNLTGEQILQDDTVAFIPHSVKCKKCERMPDVTSLVRTGFDVDYLTKMLNGYLNLTIQFVVTTTEKGALQRPSTCRDDITNERCSCLLPFAEACIPPAHCRARFESSHRPLFEPPGPGQPAMRHGSHFHQP